MNRYTVLLAGPVGPLTVDRTDDRQAAKDAARAVRGFVRDRQTGEVFCPPIGAWMAEDAARHPAMARLLADLAAGGACHCTEERICRRCSLQMEDAA